MSRIHEVKNGKATRMSFSGIKEVIDLPDLIDIQKQSYEWFLKSGLKDVLADASPISDFSGNLLLEFVDYRLENTLLKKQKLEIQAIVLDYKYKFV